MAFVKSVLYRRDRAWLLALIVIVAMVGVTLTSLLSTNVVHASAPVGASAVIQNSTATTVDIVVTGTDFDAFESSDTSTADATDRAGITYNSTNPTAAIIDNSTTMTLTFAIATGTGKSGGSLVIDANMVEDSSNVLNSAITIVDGSITDSAKPVPITATFYDTTSNDGKLDIITVVYSETLSAASTGASTQADWAVTSAANFTSLVEGVVECNSGSAGTNECDYNFTTATVRTSVGDLTLTYTAGVNDTVTDGSNTAATIALSSASSPVFTDAAAPIVISVTPASAATGSSRTNDILVQFSEAIADAALTEGVEYSLSPDPGDITGTVTTGTLIDDTYTINPAVNLVCLTTYTLTTIEAAVLDSSVAANALNTSATEDGDWSFTTGTCSGSSGGGGGTTVVAKTYSVNLTSFDDGSTVMAGVKTDITWMTDGTGTANYVNLLYSTDGGTTYTTIKKNLLNVGTYSWTIPAIDTQEAKIRVETTDLAEVLAVDTSTLLFTIELPQTEAPSDEVTAPETDNSGTSPVTGEEEVISEVNAGDYITSPSFSAIYYIDSNLVRHPFMDSQTYLTWQSSFASTKTVTDATLTTLDMGAPMLPKVRIVLVKIQSDPKVYAIDDSTDLYSPTLRWVITERIAEGLYGENWADFIIDVPVTLFSLFQFGDDVEAVTDISTDLGSMKTRAELNQ